MRTEQIDSGEKISLFYEGLSKLLGPESLVSGPEQLAAYKSYVSGFKHDMLFAVRPIFPYRIDINNMPMVVDAEDTFWRVVRELKQVFDPNGIIAPQRYNAV